MKLSEIAGKLGCRVEGPADTEITGVAGIDHAALLLDVADERAWVEALRAAIEQPDQIKLMQQRALARAAQFSWKKTAHLTREVYGNAVERGRKKS